MYGYKVYINWMLFYLGFKSTLPVDVVRQIPIEDNNEKMVNLKVETSLHFSSQVTDVFLARETVCKLLNKANSLLPDSYRLFIIEAYRSPERQIQLWNEAVALVKANNPKLSLEAVNEKARLYVAQPGKKLGGHQTGAAVDLTLVDCYNKELDLGTKVQEFTKMTSTKAKGLSKEMQNLRGILCLVMEEAGFVNYPAEWWHFSYGDQLWAAYSGKKKAFYGSAKKFL